MIQAAIAKIQEIAQAAAEIKQFSIGDRVYTNKPITEVPNSLPSLPRLLAVTTLAGLVDAINAEIEKFDKSAVVIHVCGHDKVELVSKQSDKWGRATCFVRATVPDVKGFPFGNHIDHESFLIAVQSGFTADGDRDYVLRVAANVTAEAVTTSEDDGVSQRIGMKQGVALKTVEQLRSRVVMAPFRTFREIQQPASEFVFRVKQQGQAIPTMALFEADGGKWKIDAMETIGRYLRAAVTDIPVIL